MKVRKSHLSLAKNLAAEWASDGINSFYSRMFSAMGRSSSLESQAATQWGLLRETRMRTRFGALPLLSSPVLSIEGYCSSR